MSHVTDGRGRAVKFRVELVWQGDDVDNADDAQAGEGAARPASIYLTSDGRVILQGAVVSPTERERLALPPDGEMISEIGRASCRERV